MRRRLFGAAAAGAALVLAAWLLWPRGFDSAPLMARLLAAGPEAIPVSTMLPERRWDTVCHLDPYDTPSLRLPRHTGEDLPGFAYEPYDQIIAEEENGLAFIDHDARTVYVYALPKLEAVADRTIFEIAGQRCLRRDSGRFRVEDVEAPNLSYKRLVFVSAEQAYGRGSRAVGFPTPTRASLR